MKQGYAKIPVNVLHPKTEVKAGVMGKEAGELISKFFNKLRN